MNVIEIYKQFKEQLETVYDRPEADSISDWVFESVTGLKKWKRKDPDLVLNEIENDIIQKYLEELLMHRPVQYVLNEAWFYKRKFFVDENVLIPRPETEELVEWIIDDTKKLNKENENIKVLDIGTGSGCIPISLKLEIPSSEITSIDISEGAAKTARRNTDELEAKIELIVLNFLDENEWEFLPTFDIIVSNPPYIPLTEKDTLDKNVTDFEPGTALFVADNNPFIFYEKIAGFARTHLCRDGRIYVETHEKYAREVQTIFEKSGFITEIKKDIYGRQRMVKAIFI